MTRRILVAIVTVAGLAVAGFGVPLALAVSNRYHDDAVVRLEREATSAAIQVPGSALATGDPVELPPAADNTHLALYDSTGRLIQGHGPDRLDSNVSAVLRGSATDASSGAELIVAVPVSSEERVVAVVRAAKDQDLITDQIHRAWLAMTGIAAAVVVTAGLIGALLARRLGGPVVRLASTATRLGDGDFSVRAERTGITEIDTVAAALDATADRLGRLISRERDFSADASHQLRTPLAGLRLQIESALAKPPQDHDATLSDALLQIDRLETTIDDLLALRRDTERSGAALHLSAVFDELDRRWRGPLAALGRPLRLRADDDFPSVVGSPAAVRQILDVLVANAIEHGAGTVTVTARSAGGGGALEVSDDGPGVSPDQVELIFARREVGQDRGIGLALARSLAEAEGGRLILRSSGDSPTFSLVLPATSRPS
ncbi:MAG: sensor histidine kinase [Acidimicrobiales bacterium]